jgi:hypothetical protein
MSADLFTAQYYMSKRRNIRLTFITNYSNNCMHHKQTEKQAIDD